MSCRGVLKPGVSSCGVQVVPQAKLGTMVNASGFWLCLCNALAQTRAHIVLFGYWLMDWRNLALVLSFLSPLLILPHTNGRHRATSSRPQVLKSNFCIIRCPSEAFSVVNDQLPAQT